MNIDNAKTIADVIVWDAFDYPKPVSVFPKVCKLLNDGLRQVLSPSSHVCQHILSSVRLLTYVSKC